MAVKKDRLTLYIFLGIVFAIGCALAFPHFSAKLEMGGEIFLRLLKMMVVPLVITSVMSGVLGMGDVRKLGKPGTATLGYYLFTTLVAVLIGLVIVNVIQPGVGSDPAEIEAVAEKYRHDNEASGTGQHSERNKAGVETILKNLALMLFTDNLVGAATNPPQLLPLIIFSIFFAGMLTTMGSGVSSVTTLILQLNTALMQFILLIMRLAPFGIFCLVAARFGQAQADGKFLQELSRTGWYVATVVIGLGIHAFAVLPLIYWMFTKKNPFRFMINMSQALMTAFSTASSSATLPVTLECATDRAGVSKESADFVIPLGATINMDGTALYEAAAAIFIAQAIGLELSLLQQITVAITATLAAIGAAGIPEAGLVTMIIVLNAVGLPVEYISLILSVDWLLDRFRTAVNAFGDSVGAAVVDGVIPKTKPGG